MQLATGVVDAEGEPNYHFHALRHFFGDPRFWAPSSERQLSANSVEKVGDRSITTQFGDYYYAI